MKTTRVLWQRGIPVWILLTCMALRVWGLSAQSLWWDEAYSVHLAQMPVSATIRTTAADIHPPLYYVLLHGWGALAGWSELSVRSLSLAFDLLLVAAVFALVRAMYDRATATWAMLLVALAPLHIVYAQEARMYTLLALQFLALCYALWRLTLDRRPATWATWALLVLAEVTSLYTHYFAALAVIYVNLVFGVLWLARRTRRSPLHWLAAQALALALYLPWLGIALRQAGSYTTPQAAPLSLTQFASVIWTFFLSGIYGLGTAHALFRACMAVCATLGGAALLALWLHDEARGLDVLWLAHLLVPLGAVYMLWRANPAVHPRYTLAFSLPLYVLWARAIVVLPRRCSAWHALAALLCIVWLTTAAQGWALAQFNPAFSKDDVRGMAAYVTAHSTAEDVLIVDWTDYALAYYYRGPSRIEMTSASDLPTLTPFLQRVTTGKQRVLLIHRYGASAARGLLPFALELSGRLEQEVEFKGYVLRTYRLQRAPIDLALAPYTDTWEQLQLRAVYCEDSASADNALGVVLRWRLIRPTQDAVAVSVTLRDAQGHVWTKADVPLLDDNLRNADLWTEGQETDNYYLLPVTVGTPPGTYTLWVSAYQQATLKGLDLLDASGAPSGQALKLISVQITPAENLGTDPYRTWQALKWSPSSVQQANDVTLQSYELATPEVAPGGTLSLLLAWKALRAAPAFTGLRLTLKQVDQIIAESREEPVGQYSASRWRRNELVLDRRELTVSPLAAQGAARVLLEIDGQAWNLGEVTIRGVAHVFEVPAMQHEVHARFGDVTELLGYALDRSELSAQGTLRVTLYWRAISASPPAVAYTVFAHVLNASGTLVGQHDGPPVDGQRPTTGWVQGEVLTDVHEIEFRDPAYQGTGQIEVGWYNPQDMQRLRTDNDSDHVILPTSITLIAAR